ncbi:MAG: F0F1 ATP synthase subunit delta [Patescibacteria group bacterium]
MTTQVLVTTAVALSDAQNKQLKTGLEKKYGPITIKEQIDKKVIGGLKVTIASEQLDATLEAKISQLKQNLK